MKIYDESLENTIENPDLEKGELETVQRLVMHHPEQQRKTHLEVMEGTVTDECPNGLRHEVVDQEYKAAWDEYETVQRYVPYSAEKLVQLETERKAAEEAEKEAQAAAEEATKAAIEQAEKIAKIDAIEAQATYTAMMTDTLMTEE